MVSCNRDKGCPRCCLSLCVSDLIIMGVAVQGLGWVGLMICTIHLPACRALLGLSKEQNGFTPSAVSH
jgi:hypothetical protein